MFFKRIPMYVYLNVHPKLTKPPPIEPTVSSFAYREPVASNRTQNQYSDIVKLSCRQVGCDMYTMATICYLYVYIQEHVFCFNTILT